MGMENYSRKLVRRFCKEKEKSEEANSYTSVTLKIKYPIILSYAGNQKLKWILTAVTFIIQVICLLCLVICSKNCFGCFQATKETEDSMLPCYTLLTEAAL